MPMPRARNLRTRGPAGYLFWVLSDIHASADDGAFAGRCDMIARDFIRAMQGIAEYFPDDVQAGLLLVGDLTHASTRRDYESFTKHILRPFADALGDEAGIFAVPGNHDHLRGVVPPDCVGTLRSPDGPVKLHPKSITDHYQRARLVGQPANWEDRIGSRFFLFDQWARANTTVSSERTAGPWRTEVSRRKRDPGFALQLAGLNSAIASDGSGNEKTLWIHDEQVRQVLHEPEDGVVTLTIMHHAPDRDLDAHDREALNLLYGRSTVILHGHYHERGGEPASLGRPPILRAPALGHPHPAAGVDPNKRDGCAVLRVLKKGAEMYFLSHRQPENNEPMRVEYSTAKSGAPKPDCALSYDRSPGIRGVGT